jgi:methionyl-tRNA formyltransferase
VKLIFAGTPDFARLALQAIIAAGHEVAVVLTQPDRASGRGMAQRASPVKQLALASGIEVLQPSSLRDLATQEQLRALAAEAMVVAAYGLILPQAVLDMPRFWLHQHPCVAFAALARCRTGAAGDSRWRRGDRGVHHADGGRAG